MLGLVPNFLSRLRKKRRWCAFFSTASVWADHVRSSVMWTQRNLKLFTRSTGVLSMEMGVFSALSPEIHHQLLGLVDVEWEVVLLAPFSQGTHLLSVGRLIVVGDQAYHRCVIGKFDDDVGAVCSCTVVCVQAVQEWAEDAALRGTSVEDQGMRCCCPFWPPDFCRQEVQDPAAQRSVQSQSLELLNQCGRHYGVKCWTIIHEQHPYIGVLIFRWERAVCRVVKAIASSVERFLRYANCSGSSEAGSTEQMWSLMSFSKHLLKMGVRATFKHVIIFFIGMAQWWIFFRSFRCKKKMTKGFLQTEK